MAWKNDNLRSVVLLFWVYKEGTWNSYIYPVWTQDIALSCTVVSSTPQDRSLLYLNPDWAGDFFFWIELREVAVWEENLLVCVNVLVQKAQQLAGCIQNIIHAKFPNVFCDLACISTNRLNIVPDVLNGESTIICTATWKSSNKFIFFHTSLKLIERSRITYEND